MACSSAAPSPIEDDKWPGTKLHQNSPEATSYFIFTIRDSSRRRWWKLKALAAYLLIYLDSSKVRVCGQYMASNAHAAGRTTDPFTKISNLASCTGEAESNHPNNSYPIYTVLHSMLSRNRRTGFTTCNRVTQRTTYLIKRHGIHICT